MPLGPAMNGDILALNSGSSSIKFSLFSGTQDLPLLSHGEIDGIGGQGCLRAFDREGQLVADKPLGDHLGHTRALATLVDWSQQREAANHIAAVGHRVVHSGTHYFAPMRINAEVMQQLQALIPLAPLHQPHNLAGIRALAELQPELPQVACFDTAFHCSQPEVTQLFALPRELSEAGIRRYGFHGLSYEYIASVFPQIAGPVGDGRVVVAHLGNGASMCALRECKSIATSMAFTALDGLPMGTRCGNLDPGVLLYLMEERGMSVAEVSDLLYYHSGLKGVSGISNDIRTLLASRDPHAQEAIELFVYRVGRELGSLTAALGGLDALVFTGGIGEHIVPIRARVCHAAQWLGVSLDEAANERGGPCISSADSAISVWVIPTDEEYMIARHTLAVLADAQTPDV